METYSIYNDIVREIKADDTPVMSFSKKNEVTEIKEGMTPQQIGNIISDKLIAHVEKAFVEASKK